jgi:hypothetical protein
LRSVPSSCPLLRVHPQVVHVSCQVGADCPMGAPPEVAQGLPRGEGRPAEARCPRVLAQRWAACPWLGTRPRAGGGRATLSLTTGG